jgi:hypothetical protein
MKHLSNILGLALLVSSGLFAQSYQDSYTSDGQSGYCLSDEDILIDPITVIAPQRNGRYTSLTPQAVFQNVGSETASNFFCYCEIDPMGYSAPSYIDSFAVTLLAPQATVNVTFAKWFSEGNIPYQAKFYAGRPGAVERDVYGIVNWVSFQGVTSGGIEESTDLSSIELVSRNPVKSRATINYSLPSSFHVSISIYDVNGALVSTLYDGCLAGKGSIVWDAAGADEGIYFIYMSTPVFTKALKLIVHH